MPVAQSITSKSCAANHSRVSIQWAKTKKREMSEANGGKAKRRRVTPSASFDIFDRPAGDTPRWRLKKGDHEILVVGCMAEIVFYD